MVTRGGVNGGPWQGGNGRKKKMVGGEGPKREERTSRERFCHHYGGEGYGGVEFYGIKAASIPKPRLLPRNAEIGGGVTNCHA